MKFRQTGLYRILLEFYNRFLNEFSIAIYSQEGEDIILHRFLEGKLNGFYIDVGAHHPKRFSNTYYFYKRGWSGINIEPRPGSMKIFNKVRPKDINLELAISDQPAELKYYQFNDPALNGFSKELSESRNLLDNYKIVDTIIIKTHTLAQILIEHLPTNTQIDFLTIDVEGYDYNVLLSNDWDKFKPTYVLVEELNFNIEKLDDSKIYNLLKKHGYKFVARSYNTSFYLCESN